MNRRSESVGQTTRSLEFFADSIAVSAAVENRPNASSEIFSTSFHPFHPPVRLAVPGSILSG